jgi:DNA uptake protein ComE-like DNA-binding protein
MKTRIVLLLLLLTNLAKAQEIPPSLQQQLENIVSNDDQGQDDDEFQQQLEMFRRHPVDLNTATEEELRSLIFISDLQAAQLLSYRKLLGKLISLYELQAVPGWNILLIKKLLPFITVNTSLPPHDDLRNRMRGGEQTLLFRISETLESAAGYTLPDSVNGYPGDKSRLFVRYRYQFRNVMQFGVTGEKDAGEQWLKGKQKSGFDFYSAHFFVKDLGKIRSLALGDFTVNMGQGLIQWQGLAFKKSGDITAIKRQSAILRPYNSAGEFFFERGIGIAVGRKKFSATCFASSRNIDASLAYDSSGKAIAVTSFLVSGLHRTKTENDKRNNLKQISFGGNFSYNSERWHVGFNTVHYRFSIPIQKRNEPYNLYALSGKNWGNNSVDYSFTFRNFHFFGEAAADKNFDPAFLNAILISASAKADITMLYRNISERYKAVSANAFTENTDPTNEKGLYTGLSVRPLYGWKFDVYADIYRFPWLRSLADAPSCGNDYLAQITYTPNKQVEIFSRFRYEGKQSNENEDRGVTNFLSLFTRSSWRLHCSQQISTAVSMNERVELAWYRPGRHKVENGFLLYGDLSFKPPLKNYSLGFRLQYFETDSYNARVYAYQNDLRYSSSIPAFYDRGAYFYINLHYTWRKKFSSWFHFSKIAYPGKTRLGNSLDELNGNVKTDYSFQVEWKF